MTIPLIYYYLLFENKKDTNKIKNLEKCKLICNFKSILSLNMSNKDFFNKCIDKCCKIKK